MEKVISHKVESFVTSGHNVTLQNEVWITNREKLATYLGAQNFRGLKGSRPTARQLLRASLIKICLGIRTTRVQYQLT